MASSTPLIVTLTLDKASHTYCTELRTKYYPAHCNYLEAHLTLFHRLPSDKAIIDEILQKMSKRNLLELQISSVKNLGNGVAFSVTSTELKQLHKTMQQELKPYLITKDRMKAKPHITLQNKVTVFKAQQTAELLSKDFKPFIIQGIGFSSWLYKKGYWQHVKDYLFEN